MLSFLPFLWLHSRIDSGHLWQHWRRAPPIHVMSPGSLLVSAAEQLVQSGSGLVTAIVWLVPPLLSVVQTICFVTKCSLLCTAPSLLLVYQLTRVFCNPILGPQKLLGAVGARHRWCEALQTSLSGHQPPHPAVLAWRHVEISPHGPSPRPLIFYSVLYAGH